MRPVPDARCTTSERILVFAISERGREFAGALFVIALASVMLHRTFGGDWPVNHDHPVHLFRIWQLKQHLLAHGTPWSWSQRWFAGCPISTVYPVGADFFVLAVQALSFGALSLSHAYALAFWLFYVLYAYGSYYFISRAVHSRIAACIGVLFLLADPGWNDMGGWFWYVDVGVWTAALGMAPALIGTVRVADLLENPRARTAAVLAVYFGLAVLCHQLHLVYFAIVVPLLCFARYISVENTDWRRSFIWLGAAGVCGLLIASFWLVPNLSAAHYLADIGWTGDSLSEIGAKLARGQLFNRMPWLMVAFGFVGSLVFLAARRPLPLLMALFTFVAIFVSSSTFSNLFGPDVAQWLNDHMIFPRLLMLLKPFWYGAGAFLLIAGIKSARDLLARPAESAMSDRHRALARTAIVAFVCICLVPVLYPCLQTFVREEVLRPTKWAMDRPDLAARAAFIEWANNEFSRSSGFFRIAHGFDQDEHSLTDLGIDVPYPLYKIFRTPTGHFKYALGSDSNAALRAVNVRFILAEHPLNRPDFLLQRNFGQGMLLYAFKNWNPQPFEISQGAGVVQLEQFEDEAVVLRADATAHGLLRLNVTYFPKWHATRDGVPVRIKPIPVPDVNDSLFMQVPLAPGVYRFEYRRGFADYAGSILCLLGIAGCVALAKPDWFGRVWLRAAVIFGNPVRLFSGRKRNPPSGS
jgi:6-pyruvoyl-tetrahydropterin synthase related domain